VSISYVLKIKSREPAQVSTVQHASTPGTHNSQAASSQGARLHYSTRQVVH